MSGLIMLMLLIPASPVGSLGIGNILVPGDSLVSWEHLCAWKQPSAWGSPVQGWQCGRAAHGLQCRYQTACRFVRVLLWTALHTEVPGGSLRRRSDCCCLDLVLHPVGSISKHYLPGLPCGTRVWASLGSMISASVIPASDLQHLGVGSAAWLPLQGPWQDALFQGLAAIWCSASLLGGQERGRALFV